MEGIQGKIVQVSLVVFLACFLNCWMIGGTEAFSGQRDPFAFPAGVQKGVVLKEKAGTGPGTGTGKAVQGSVPGFRVTTILVSGRTRVAAINGVLMKKGDKLDDYRIVEIEDHQVTLSRGKEKLMLKIDSEAGYSFKKLNSTNRVMGF
ncbi:MAG: hypothetical protein ABSE95_07690 [Thermodesulfobacteriota bacterium]|jgi:hypothetical protein